MFRNDIIIQTYLKWTAELNLVSTAPMSFSKRFTHLTGAVFGVLFWYLFYSHVCFLRKSLSLDSLGTNANINYYINHEIHFPLCSEYKVHKPHNTVSKNQTSSDVPWEIASHYTH